MTLTTTGQLKNQIEAIEQPPGYVKSDTEASHHTLYRQELVRCGKANCKKCVNGPAHGPYWYSFQTNSGKTTKKYLGKELPEKAKAERDITITPNIKLPPSNYWLIDEQADALGFTNEVEAQKWAAKLKGSSRIYQAATKAAAQEQHRLFLVELANQGRAEWEGKTGQLSPTPLIEKTRTTLNREVPPQLAQPEVKLKKVEKEKEKIEVKKKLDVCLWLRIENNNKYVRGKGKVRQEIEQYVLSHYNMQKPYKDSHEYNLTISYKDEAELDKIIYDILQEAESLADARNCFTESDIRALDGSERYW